MQNKADLLVLGNVITMDERKPRAEAVAAKGDKILYVGAAEIAKRLCSENTKVIDYGANSVYPGFLEAHCHPGLAGWRMSGVAHLNAEASLEECIQIMKDYAAANPNKDLLMGWGFGQNALGFHASLFDEICPDKPMTCSEQGGHIMWLNTKAMEKFGIDESAVEKWGTACVHVDADGKPTGVIAEGPVMQIVHNVPISIDEMKDNLLAWQDYALSMGYTGVYNAGVELLSPNEPLAFYELEKEGKLRQYTFSGSLVRDNTDTPEEDMDHVAAEAAEHDSKHYRILGAKVFCDGVVEGHTAWLLDDYRDEPGYRGVSRFDDHDKIVRLVKAAASHGMNVHIHAIGDAASKAWVDGIAEAEEAMGNFDMRNALAHLHIVHPDVVRRFGEYNVVAVAGIMWDEKEPYTWDQEIEYVGEERASNGYPMKSFMDAGAVLVSHSDYPVSPEFSAPWTICFGTAGHLPSHGEERVRHPDQHLSRLDALKAVTTNVAWSWHAEDRMGSLAVGKLANMAVFDKDFLADDLAEVENARCLATFIDGELVFEA